jgi:hypothetical protein
MLQVTLVFVVFSTVAANGWLWFTTIAMADGDTATVIGSSVIVAVADFELSALLVARTVAV